MSVPDFFSSESGLLTFKDAKQLARFELGVACAIFLWEELSVAVDNMWGGPESADKREWMVGSVLELFERENIATEDIEFRILAILEDEFDVTLETDSGFQVAQQIMKFYALCENQNYTAIDEIFERYQKSQSKPKVQVQIEDEESESGSEDEEEHAMDVDVGSTLREPEIDEDGFQTVRRRRRN